LADRIPWPWYLAAFVVGLALVFGGIAARDSLGTAANIVVPVGGIAAVMAFVLWWRALIRRHGPGRMLIWLVVILAVLFVIGLIIQHFVADREREMVTVTAFGGRDTVVIRFAGP